MFQFMFFLLNLHNTPAITIDIFTEIYNRFDVKSKLSIKLSKCLTCAASVMRTDTYFIQSVIVLSL